MSRLVAVSLQQYRLHDLEITDRGREGHVVLVRPPAGRGEPVELMPEDPKATLARTIGRAKTLIDAVMGPRPPPRALPRRR